MCVHGFAYAVSPFISHKFSIQTMNKFQQNEHIAQSSLIKLLFILYHRSIFYYCNHNKIADNIMDCMVYGSSISISISLILSVFVFSFCTECHWNNNANGIGCSMRICVRTNQSSSWPSFYSIRCLDELRYIFEYCVLQKEQPTSNWRRQNCCNEIRFTFKVNEVFSSKGWRKIQKKWSNLFNCTNILGRWNRPQHPFFSCFSKPSTKWFGKIFNICK